MRIPSRQRPPAPPPGLVGTARVDRRTRLLLPRLRPGDVAVVDHLDMDRATAQGLVDAGVAAVVNAAPMISGRYANLGPEVLAAAGVVLVDGIGVPGLGRDQGRLPGPAARGDRVRRRRGRRRRPRGRRRHRPRADGRGPHGPGDPARDVHPQQHRVPAPRAGPAAARPGPAPPGHPDRRPPGRRGRPGPRVRRRAARDPALPARAGAGPDRRRAGRRRAGRGRLPPRRRRALGRRRRRDRPSAKTLRAARDVVVRVDRGGDRSATERWSGSASARCAWSPRPRPRTPR